MKRTKKYIAIFLALLILTSTISTQNVYADQNDTHEAKTTVSEEVMDHSEDTIIEEENSVEKVEIPEEEKEIEEAEIPNEEKEIEEVEITNTQDGEIENNDIKLIDNINKLNETIIVEFKNYNILENKPYMSLTVENIDDIVLPKTIVIINANDKEVEVNAIWENEDNETYVLTIPDEYTLSEELQVKLENGEIKLPYITVNVIKNEIETKEISVKELSELIMPFSANIQALAAKAAPTITYKTDKKAYSGTNYYPDDTKITITWSNIKYIYDSYAKTDIYFISGKPTWSHSDDYNFNYWTKGKNIKKIGSVELGEDSFSVTMNLKDVPTNAKGLSQLTVDGNYVAQYTLEDFPTKDDRDTTAPTITHKISGTIANGYYAPGSTIQFTASDADSGIDYIEVNGIKQSNNYIVTPPTGASTYTYKAYDKAGLSSAQGSVSINIDGTAPTLAGTITGSLVNGWYKGATSITFTASDAQSGLASLTYDKTAITSGTKISVSEGTHTYDYVAKDNVGNESTGSTKLSVDASAPVNVSIANGGTTGWTKNNLPLTIKGQDIYSGLASLKVQYSPNNSTWTDYGTITCNGEITLKEDKTSISADKNGYYKVIATDCVGYTKESAVLTVSNIDQSAPILSHTIDGDLKKNNWYKGDANLNLTASDTGGSGIKSITVNSNVTLGDKRTVDVTSEGENVYNCIATDNAGNPTDPPKKITVKVDKSAPVNLSMTPNTTEWTKNPVNITAKADDAYSGVDTIELQYTEDKKHPNWQTYKTESLSGANQANKNFSVTDNGYYRLVVTDQVGFETTTDDKDILEVINYDPDAPDSNTIGIEPDTIQWVDEAKGVEVTSYGSDQLSGLNTVEVWEKSVGGDFIEKKKEKYNGETTVESATYDTHINKSYLTKITDQAGNELKMKEEEALEVDNIDPEAPELTIEPVSTQEEYISTTEGYVIRAVIEDSQSGVGEVSLQKLNESGEWEDYKAQYHIIRAEGNEESKDGENLQADNQEEEPVLSKVARERVMVMAASNVYLSSSNNEGNETQVEVREQGDTKVVIEYTVRENGIYRLRGADLVQNTAYTDDTIEITNLDGSMPEIHVEGNPIIWQNTDAIIKVIAKDADSKIADMTLDGDKKAFTEGEDGSFYFTFDATKNQEFSVTASDEAGNTTTEIIKVKRIDKEAPILNTDIKKSWLSMIIGDYRNLKIDATDDLSGIESVVVRHNGDSSILAEYSYENAKIYYQGNYKIKEIGDYEIIISDHAGNVVMQTISESNLDFSAPWLKVEGNPTIWQNTDAMIQVTAFDEDSAISKMTLNGKEQEFELNNQGEAVFAFTAIKNEKFIVVAYDEADHATSQVIEVTKIDKEKPIIETVLTARWLEDGYRNVKCEGFDYLSGIDTITLEHEGVKEVLSSFEYEKEQKNTANDYQITENGEYMITITDHAGNTNQTTVTEEEAKLLKAMEVIVLPEKTKYKETENFMKKGMVVDAIYNNNSRKEDIKDYVILDGMNLVLAQDKINLSYTEGDKTVYTDTTIKVSAEPIVPEEPGTPETPLFLEEPTPAIPKTPISPTPETPTPVIEIKEVEEVKEEIKEEPTKELKELPDNTGLTDNESKLPIGTILAGVGLFIILLFLLLSNVKVYCKNEDGEWRFLGKTRALKAKDKYLIRISKHVRIRATSNSYKLVFSKMFKRFHEECDLIIKIDKQDHEKRLTKDNDTIYVDHKE